MFDESLGVIDFCPSSNIAVVYVNEAELVAGSAYRRRLVTLRKVTDGSLWWNKSMIYNVYC